MKKDWNKFYVLIGTSFFTLSIAGTRPLVPLFSKELGANNAEIGLIVTMFSLVPLFISITLGKIIDRRGTKIPLLVSILIGFVSLFIPFLFQNLLGVYVSQLLAGVSQLLFVLSIQSLAGQSTEITVSETYIATFSIGVALGGFIGPIISGILSDMYRYPFAILVSGLLILLALPFSLNLKHNDVKKEKTECQSETEFAKSFELLKNSNIRNAIIVSGVLLLGKDMYIAFFPLLAEEQGISNAFIGIIISINALGGVLIRLLLPVILKYYNNASIITISLLFVGVFYLMNPFISSFILLCTCSFLLGLFLGIGQPLSIAATIQSLPTSRIGEGLGLRLSFNKLTQVVAPVILGGVSHVFGIISLFFLTGFTVLVGAFYSRKS